MRNLWWMYSYRYAYVLTYMLQSTEYEVGEFLKWWWHVSRFDKVINRRKLDHTLSAKLIKLLAVAAHLMLYLIGLFLIYLQSSIAVYVGIAVILLSPVLVAHLIVIPLIIARYLIFLPRQNRAKKEMKKILSTTKAIKVVVAGSYGKTTVKELLATVLSEQFKVGFTPGNMNQPLSHHRFVKQLNGDEEVLIFELGEYRYGDIVEFCNYIQPDYAFVTGINQAHLEKFGNQERLTENIMTVRNFVKDADLYINGDSTHAVEQAHKQNRIYTNEGLTNKFKVRKVKVTPESTKFEIIHNSQPYSVTINYLGEHYIGPVVAIADLGLRLGMKMNQIVGGLTKSKPYKHRMEVKKLYGATIIDDTYNGNIDGIRAGLNLLKGFKATGRKIYITPGLVEHGDMTETIHVEIGHIIAATKPDVVYLIKNSVQPIIAEALLNAGFKGKIVIVEDPLEFYNSLETIVANGDIVLMQNDWTDNYY